MAKETGNAAGVDMRLTLPHVLCHCKPNVSITKDHNAIQDRLVRVFNSLASTTIRINQAVPFFDASLRLYLQDGYHHRYHHAI